MDFQKNGIRVSVADDEVRRIVIERLTEGEILLSTLEATDPPVRIGEVWTAQGGVYAGIARGRDGHSDYHLIVGPQADGDLDWSAADKWAAALKAEGCGDFSLPFRKEQALCFANVPELFEERAYWSCEQHASDSSHAWYQNFNYGNQNYATKNSKRRARAVRRLPIQ